MITFFVSRSYLGNKFYEIKVKYSKLFISVIAVYILAALSSIYKFNMIIFVATILSSVIVMFMYRNVISDVFKMIMSFLKRKK